MIPASPGPQRIIFWLLVGICAFVAIDCFFLLNDGIELLLKPFPTCKTELWIVGGVQAVAKGRELYPPLNGLPYIIRVYNPLTYLPGALFGAGHADDFEHLLVVSRLLPFLSMFAALAIVGAYVRRSSPVGRGWLRGLIAVFAVALVCVFHSSTLTDFFRNRPEMPGLTLSVAAWFMIQRRRRDGGPDRSPYLAGALAVAAIGFKQSYISAPIAIALQLLLSKQRRDLWRFLVTLVSLGGLLVLASYLLLGRGYFDHTLFAMASNPSHLIDRSIFFYSILAREHWGALLPAALFCAAWLALKRQELWLLLYLAVCLVWTTFSHGKVGADINYHGELSLLMVIIVGVGIAKMTSAAPRLAFVPLAILSAFFLYLSVQLGYGHNRVCFNRIAPTPHCERKRPPFGDVSEHEKRLARVKDDLLVLHEELAVRLDRAVVLDWYLIDMMLENGFFKLEPLLEIVRERRKAHIVLPRRISNRWLRQILLTALARGYRVSLADRTIIHLRLTKQAAGRGRAPPGEDLSPGP